MPSESPSSQSVPPFASTLPPEFLDGLDQRGRYLYEKIDGLSQAMTYTLAQNAAHSEKLEEVRIQTVKTNGRVLAAEADIRAIKADQTEIKGQVETVKTVKTVVRSKWFWIGAAVFFLVVLPWAAEHIPPSKVWEALVTIVSGA